MIDLSQFPMHKKPYSDGTLIQWSKSELIEYIRLIEGNYKTLYQVYIQSVKNAEKMLGNHDPAPHWIPVTERLPEKDGRYWVWAEKSFVPDHVDEPNTFRGSTEANFILGRWYGLHVEKVFAWQPLPDPYKGGE